ncbi:adenosylcobalamin-dependent ribonucleoside-diphosphate reductase [Serpentinimonas barnesii]|uniref:adenosylcobalamin-dependent ribonucleoside-diphosphate reductase n=1 Tax=Serpentinimonas barnesii TaxID=1458427 RepID=UPI000496C2D5|nr:adenosylcobalamin-dependent ribonucleoside-diphosphate reductase [Serpentinimonas barnesii]
MNHPRELPANLALIELPPQPISLDVLREKYLKGEERSADDLFDRLARALASVEAPEQRAQWEARFRRNLAAGAIGAGRIMSAAGSGIQATLINCFVQPVGDCIQGEDDAGFPGIYEALREAAETMRRGGGVGYDFSRIRPKGARVKGTASTASGPCSYINVFDQSCATVESAGARRGAQMGVLRIDHPDVLEFITAKRSPGRWNNFNVSVAVSDAFIDAVQHDREWELVHPAHPGAEHIAAGAQQRADGQWVYQRTRARTLWDAIMRSAYDFAEPGILFLDQIQRDNNLRALETIAATNPCGEQPLPPYGCCDLGPVILPRFVHHPFNHGGAAAFDFAAFADSVALQVRALDNVLELTHWPLPQQHRESQAKRRIGVGFTGLGDTLVLLGLRYDSAAGREMARRIAECMRDAAYRASVELAREKGAFPLFEADSYLEAGTFASRLPPELQASIRAHGIRNSHLLSIAPTGTVSLAFADNASNGIEPAFSWTYLRKKREADGSRSQYEVQDHAWRLYRALGHDVSNLPDYFVSALEMSAHEHIAMMEAVQPYVDTAISKTVNVAADYPYEDFKDLYLQAWRAGLKGLATYRPNSILGAVLETMPEAAAPAAAAAPSPSHSNGSSPAPDPMRSVIESRPKGALDAVAEKIEYWTHEGHKRVYLIVSFLPLPRPDGPGHVERAIEFFMPVGQYGESQQWITASMRLLSLAARGGFLERALSDMRKVAWDRGPVRHGHKVKEDGTQVPLWHDSEVAAIAYAIQNILALRAQRALSADQLSLGLPEPDPAPAAPAAVLGPGLMAGKKCPECGAHAMIRRDGCDYCTACGHVGVCG